MVRVMDWKTSAWCLGPQRKAKFLVQQCSAKDHIAVGKPLTFPLSTTSDDVPVPAAAPSADCALPHDPPSVPRGDGMIQQCPVEQADGQGIEEAVAGEGHPLQRQWHHRGGRDGQTHDDQQVEDFRAHHHTYPWRRWFWMIWAWVIRCSYNLGLWKRWIQHYNTL